MSLRSIRVHATPSHTLFTLLAHFVKDSETRIIRVFLSTFVVVLEHVLVIAHVIIAGQRGGITVQVHNSVGE